MKPNRMLLILPQLLLISSIGNAQTTPGVHFTIDQSKDVHAISRYIYGINHPLDGPYSRLTMSRLGGNRWSCYNWLNNASNAGNDYRFQNDDYMGGSEIGEPVAEGITDAFKANAAIIVTVPINGYVSADKNPPGDVRNSGPDYLSTRFRREEPMKGTPFSLAPDPNSPVVYQDEFVNWVKTRFPDGFTNPAHPIFFMLDNEPGIWSETHREVHPLKLTYEELVEKSIAYANAIKLVAPNTRIFGPADFGFSGFINLQNAPDAGIHGDFLTYYLKRMAAAEQIYGRRLLDVLDLHWYPEAKGGGIRITEAGNSPELIAARLQAPRSLWDTSYVENSWIPQNLGGPTYLLPREQAKIDQFYPGTRFSISEYNYGGPNEISGAIAEADVLGIFGKANLFAACEWPLADNEPYIAAGFAMYRNYDGKRGSFGDQSVSARTDDPVNSSVYAGIYSDNSHSMSLMAINKTNSVLNVDISIAPGGNWKSAQVYQLTADRPSPVRTGDVAVNDGAHFVYAMPAMSVSTIILRGEP